MWNPKGELEIGTDESNQTRWNPSVDGYRSGIGSTTVTGSGIQPGLELSQPIFAVQTRTAGRLPAPVAITCAHAANPHMTNHAHFKIVCKTGGWKNKTQHAVGWKYIHIEANGGQLIIYCTVGVWRQLGKEFISALRGDLHGRQRHTSPQSAKSIIMMLLPLGFLQMMLLIKVPVSGRTRL